MVKGLFNLAPGCIVDGDFCLPNEIDSWNFQHMLLFWFHEASQIWAYLENFFWFFSIFPLVPPWKLWKKSCLNKLKFWEASRNQKRSICWKFQLSISLGTQKGTGAIGAGPTMIKPFVLLYSFWTLFENVHCQGLCSLRPCISRPYCNSIALDSIL